jgi:hypothetical protein
MAGAALAGALALGLQDTFDSRDPVPIVVDYAGDPQDLEDITLFFHPTVPEATLVLVR